MADFDEAVKARAKEEYFQIPVRSVNKIRERGITKSIYSGDVPCIGVSPVMIYKRTSSVYLDDETSQIGKTSLNSYDDSNRSVQNLSDGHSLRSKLSSKSLEQAGHKLLFENATSTPSRTQRIFSENMSNSNCYADISYTSPERNSEESNIKSHHSNTSFEQETKIPMQIETQKIHGICAVVFIAIVLITVMELSLKIVEKYLKIIQSNLRGSSLKYASRTYVDYITKYRYYKLFVKIYSIFYPSCCIDIY